MRADVIGGEAAKLETQIARKRKDVAELQNDYDARRKRYLEITEKTSAGSSAGAASGKGRN